MHANQLPQPAWHAKSAGATIRRLTTWVLGAVCISLLPTISAQAQQIDLGTAAQYSGFFFGNVSKIPDIEGRMALGGDLIVGGPSIGGRVPAGSTQPSLVVGGNITAFTGGTIWSNGHTDSWGVYAGTKAAGVAHYHDLRKVDVSPVDFAAERTYLTILSQQLRDTPPTGTVSQLYSEVTLTGSNRDIEYFNLKAEHVINRLNFALKNIKPTAYLILNVASDDQRKVRLSINMSAFANRNKRVLLNLHDTDVLNMLGVRVEGSVLAPYACVKESSGHLEGTIVAASWDNSMEIGYGPFEPTSSPIATTSTTTTVKPTTTTTTKKSTTTTKATTTTTKASTTTTVSVATCPAYVKGSTYVKNANVRNVGRYFSCKVAASCSSNASIYEPGVGTSSSSAWKTITAANCK